MRPDLASSHYSRDSIAEFERLGIEIVPKEANPPAVPRLRPIENFWAILKNRVYSKGWAAKSTEELVKKIKTELRLVPPEFVQNLMRRVKTKVRTAADHGVLSVIN